MPNLFNRTGGLKPGRSVFDLSYAKLFDVDAGFLVPVMCDEMVPGDYFKISNECIVRLTPLVAPVLHNINITVHYFFVPYRLLWDGWENFITGGVDGNDASSLLRWNMAGTPGKYTLWDYMGFPLVQLSGLDRPLLFPAQAYDFIWNEYYRDETLQTKIDFKSIGYDATHGLQKRDWRKDYFTSALPWTQRGTAPALPISGTTHAIWGDSSFEDATGASTWHHGSAAGSTNKLGLINPGSGSFTTERDSYKAALNSNVVDLSSATTFTVSDLRLSVQIQKWMERNARAGVRYIEFLQEHFAVHPRDERLQRPEYIGGSKQPLIVSEVLKTSQDGANPQGNLAGHGLSAAMNSVAKYHAKEFGLVMGLMSIMPEPMYNSQGIDRQWLRRSRFDFPFPEFAHLSEQAIEREEIYATANDEATNRGIWGYQGRFDELRIKRSGTAANMRDTLSYWHLGRIFASAPALNDAFLQCDGSTASMRRIFAAQSVPGYIVHFGNKIIASRPIPYMSEPGLMDHF